MENITLTGIADWCGKVYAGHYGNDALAPGVARNFKRGVLNTSTVFLVAAVAKLILRNFPAMIAFSLATAFIRYVVMHEDKFLEAESKNAWQVFNRAAWMHFEELPHVKPATT